MFDTPSPFDEREEDEFTAEQLSDEYFLRRLVRKQNKELSRQRKDMRRDLQHRLAKAAEEVLAKEAGLALHDANANPDVQAARQKRKDCESFLQDFDHALTLKASLENINQFHEIKTIQFREASSARPYKWRGDLSMSAFDLGSTYVHLGGELHRGLNIKTVKHDADWKITSGENNCVLKVPPDPEPSYLHGGPKLTPEEMRLMWNTPKSASFKPGGHIPCFGTTAPDHPKHGMPFPYRQKIRTFFERRIAYLRSKLAKIPNYPRRNELLKEEYQYSLAETLRAYHSVTGKKELRLEKNVGAAKKRIKGKLHMLHSLNSKDGGDMSFLKEIAELERKELAKLGVANNKLGGRKSFW